jgi:hypothetical protein
MKKFIAQGLMMTMFFTLTACQSQPTQPGQTADNKSQGPTIEEIAAKPFTMEYEYSEQQIKSLTENDTMNSIAVAGPFYAGKADFVQPGLQKFQEMKTALVEEIMKNVEQLNKDSQVYAAELKTLKNKYIDYLGQTLEQNNKLGKQLKEVAKAIIEPEVKYTTNFVHFDSIDTAAITQPATAALMKYQKTYLALENVDLLSRDTAETVGGLMNLEAALQKSPESKMKEIGTAIITGIPAEVDALGVKLVALQEKQQEVNVQLKQLNTAEYYMGMASVQFVEENLAAIQPQLDSLVPRDNLSAGDIEFIKELAGHYGEFNKEIKQQLAQVDQKELLAFADEDLPGGLIPVALAEEPGYAQKALEMLKGVGKSGFEGGKSLGKFTWETAKAGYNTATTVIGVELDTLGAHTKSAADVIYGVANGNSVGEITTEIASNYKKIGDNFKAGKSGSEILTTATGYFDAVEKGTGKAAENAVESVMGKGWSSWLAGHAGEMTANLFTSLGKGITKVANTQSTTGEVVEGTLDIGLSFIGGSKVLVSGSQFAKGSKEAVKLFGEKGINLIGNSLFKGDVKAIRGLSTEILKNTKLTPEQVTKLITNAIDIEIKEAITAEIAATSKAINQKFLDLIKKAGMTIEKNATAGAKEAYKEFVETAFENTLKGYKDSLIAVLGKDFTTYIDNLVANKADDLLKEMTKDFIDKGIIPGINTAPDLKDLAGKWGEGSMVISDVETTEAFRAQAAKEGCDISEIEKQKGKKQALSITMEPTGEEGGNMVLKFGDGESKTLPFTYNEGNIVASFSEKDAAVSINMNVTEENGVYKNNGGLEISYMGGGLKIKADVSASKELPKPPVKPVTAVSGDAGTAPQTDNAGGTPQL